MVVWNYAQMHQNTFLTIPDVKKYIFLEHDSGVLEVCANALKDVLTTLDVITYLFKEYDSGGLEVCPNALKHVFDPSRHKKKLF